MSYNLSEANEKICNEISHVSEISKQAILNLSFSLSSEILLDYFTKMRSELQNEQFKSLKFALSKVSSGKGGEAFKIRFSELETEKVIT